MITLNLMSFGFAAIIAFFLALVLGGLFVWGQVSETITGKTSIALLVDTLLLMAYVIGYLVIKFGIALDTLFQ